MHLVICTRTEAYVVHDRRGTLLESIRRFFKVLGRFFPETAVENCEWRSSLAAWPELDAFLSVPRKGCEARFATVMEIFVHYFLEMATMRKRLRGKTPLDLAWGRWRENEGRIVLTARKSLRFDGQETFAFIRSESLYPLIDMVENLDRRKFQGLACRVALPDSQTGGSNV
jgi:hypothetical protein